MRWSLWFALTRVSKKKYACDYYIGINKLLGRKTQVEFCVSLIVITRHVILKTSSGPWRFRVVGLASHKWCVCWEWSGIRSQHLEATTWKKQRVFSSWKVSYLIFFEFYHKLVILVHFLYFLEMYCIFHLCILFCGRIAAKVCSQQF